MDKQKSSHQMERHLKGMANHHRIDILFVIARTPGITLEEIVNILKANEKTIGEHTRKLHQVGLINKKYHGKFVQHRLSPYGEIFVNFLSAFQRVK